MKITIAGILASFGIVAGLFFGAPLALAGVQDDVLCSSNMAYRTTHASACVDIAIGSHGGGGGMPDDNGNGVDDRLE